MIRHAVWMILIPFAGTTLGAAAVFLMKNALRPSVQKVLTGFAAGVMTAASIWSLLVPALQRSAGLGRWAFVPAAAGFWLGILFLLALDRLIPHLHQFSDTPEGPVRPWKDTTLMLLAVTIHNLPEGMAVGAVTAGWLSGDTAIPAAGVLALALGIAIQNFPEGAIISLPLHARGLSRPRSFILGVLSGAVEPLGAAATLLFSRAVVTAMPYLLSFAAGAMLYVVVEELIPEMSAGPHNNAGVLSFALGFSLMMALDVAWG